MKLFLTWFLLWLAPLAASFAQAPNTDIFLPDPIQPADQVVRPVLTDLIPTLSVKDLQAATQFYTGKLGFYVVLQSGSHYTAVARDSVQIGLALDKNKPAALKGSLYIQTRSIDVLYNDLKKRGVKMLTELKTQPSKMREFSLADPDGNTMIFGEYTGQN